MFDAKTDTSPKNTTTEDTQTRNADFTGFTSALSDCFGIPVDQLDEALCCCSAEKLASFLAGTHESAARLRKLLDLDPAVLDAQELAVALSRPKGLVCRAVFRALDRMAARTLDPKALLTTRSDHTRQCILAAWNRAIRLVAPAGYISREDAYDLGIGAQVFDAMVARHGKTDIEALSHGEFMALAPQLIASWPVNEDALAALTDLLHELEDLIEMHNDARFAAMMLDMAQ